MAEQTGLTELLREAEKAYNEKRYLDARDAVKERKEDFIRAGMGAVALRRWAWAAYYLGNEGNPQWKKWINPELKVCQLQLVRIRWKVKDEEWLLLLIIKRGSMVSIQLCRFPRLGVCRKKPSTKVSQK